MIKKQKIGLFYSRNWMFVIGILFFSVNVLLAQDDDEATKNKARLSLAYAVTNNIGPRLIGTVKSKVGRVYENIPNVKVNFYLDEISTASKLGESITNSKGEAVFIPPETRHGDIQFLYLATIEDDDDYEDNETEIEVEKSFTDLKLEVEDSIKLVRFFVGRPDSTGIVVPEEDVEVMIYVKRLFGLLPLMEETDITDEEGIFTIEFPNDIPGDEQGNITIIAKVPDHETFGTLEAVKKIDWGIPLKPDEKVLKRELWSARSNAPISLIVIINVMLIGIWGIIFYVILQLLKIRKIGRDQLVD